MFAKQPKREQWLPLGDIELNLAHNCTIYKYPIRFNPINIVRSGREAQHKRQDQTAIQTLTQKKSFLYQ
ncbi:hypothetical protein A0J61_06345 [Choanephora cucurbitarum]|uniref:Uncharacterized protein n=1 Tax=Choanephora cucurbitarum TaxID=101091 RepID=A0A1C7NAE8_9FUNG|nr:hypothetical protein A0J61_06345 [Choanephora cucurbitarum]